MIEIVKTGLVDHDGSAPYLVIIEGIYTVNDLIREIFKLRKNEWGRFNIMDNTSENADYIGVLRYQAGKLIDEMISADLLVKRATACGGQSNMDYYIYV